MRAMRILLMLVFCFGGGCFTHFLFGTPLDQFEQSYTKRWGGCKLMEKGFMFQYYERWREANKHRDEIEQASQALAVVDAWLLMGPEAWTMRRPSEEVLIMEPEDLTKRLEWTPEEVLVMEMISDFQFLSRLVELESEQRKLRLQLWQNARELYYLVASQLRANGITEDEWDQIAEQLKSLETLEERKVYLQKILKSKCKDSTVLSSGKPYHEEAQDACCE